MKRKLKVNAVGNGRMDIGYAGYTEPGYYWTEYDTSEYLLDINEDKLT